MNYQETLTWMFGRLPMYQKQGKSAFKKDLTNILAFAEVLQQPQHNFKSIHVGGTNGKGSSSHMLASVLQEAGYKVGLYTSPHLKDFTERIKINGKEIRRDFVIKFIETHQTFLEKQGLSFFEMTVGMAFAYFHHEKVDVAIVEVGLGGRLDSTNIIQPELSIITNIGLDHTQFLGDSISAIAGEKAGIIKPNTPVVIGETSAASKKVFLAKAEAVHAPISFAEECESIFLTSDLKGDYQEKNKQTVAVAVENLRNQAWNISHENLQTGLAKVVVNTGLRGRWEMLQDSPKVIADTGHNEEGLKIVLNQLKELNARKLHIVLGFVNDKDLDQLLPMFPQEAVYYFCQPNVERGMPVSILVEKAKDFKLNGNSYSSVKEALAEAKLKAQPEEVIFVGGSTFTVAEIL
ncbi:MAG: bifunctional folylpolyglutamate synthase/dihydrofolate synthase [Mesonia sp.]|uniref:bifunctional folylpolyglutamate synthase/dihydrofolate synthase n=1 Tax=Mesonia sp. TaxID=1960830 RepID=UPI003F957C3B